MSNELPENLKTTPLIDVHREWGARLVSFAGWNMPIQYAGVVAEHLCVREKVGLFDVSHMGEVEIEGKDAQRFLQYLLSNDIEKMSDGAILYTLMCYENGGVVDDLLVHRFAKDRYFLCVNASNTDKDYDWIVKNAGDFEVTTKNTSAQTAQLALQGPRAQEVLQPLCDVSLNDLSYYHFKNGKIGNVDGIVSRTGYTGEDGFELYLPGGDAAGVFRALMKQGEPCDIQPIGLGARDTLRLEMGYALYGHEIDAQSSPLEAGLGWVIKFSKGEFIGRESLLKQKEAGLKRRLAGLKLLTRGVPRDNYRVLKDGEPVGRVTSGTFSPSLNTGVGLCYVSREHSEIGARLEVEIRNRSVPAEVVKPPFVPSRVKK
ncbi:glycine cleavage system protein T [Candidatus Nitromaritima sp. SCGC AAA799-C22]|nr:glycine cleavage system protein T [Candidatus Nitromaritima sp. SCGC AAA799-C22]